jgi:hypothetical protein
MRSDAVWSDDARWNDATWSAASEPPWNDASNDERGDA